MENDSAYDNMEPAREVAPNTIVTNALSIMVMYAPVAEFSELFRKEKSSKLHTLREPLEIMQQRIDVIPNSV